ncbi:Cytochrome c biogenesis protein Ccs1 [bioreactor metagenome]|uniref:Cytochrome c biogenesis protein Ccs1 n=1 Tax=bioreactor metagenome TaxID=1076179 RepID=A0A644Z3G1_9ZZZZ
MKKVLMFLRSMKFGMALLLMVAACSLAGSIIPQGCEPAYYLNTYKTLGSMMLTMKADRIFTSWYFIVLVVLLCVNLIFCSILRLGSTAKMYRTMPALVTKAELEETPASQEEIESYLKAKRFRQVKTENGMIWAKNRSGHYGSFIVHLALLLMLSCSAAVLSLSASEDVAVHVNETAALKDGTQIYLDSFRTADKDGTKNFVSQITVCDTAKTAMSGQVSVNHPLSAAGKKFYQYDYGTDGQLTVTYDEVSETLFLTKDDENRFFSVDGENGMVYYGLYPDYILDASGKAEPVKESPDGYPNPIYAVNLVGEGESGVGLVKPGTTLAAGGIYFAFGSAVDYSVIRVKTYPSGALALLYISFVLMLAGLWLCFFQVPIYVSVDSRGFAIRSMKPEMIVGTALRSLKREGSISHA